MTSGQRKLVIAGGVALGVVATVLLAARESLQAGHVSLVLAALATSLAVYLLWGIVAPIVGLEGASAVVLTEAQRVRLELLRDKDTALESLRELEFDRATGKIGAVDYEPMKRELEAQAIGAMRALDDEAARWERKIETEVRRELVSRGVRMPEPAGHGPAPAKAEEPGAAAGGGRAVEAPPAAGAGAAPPADSAEDVFAKIEKLAELVKKGAITAEDFERKKQDLLSRI